MKRLIFALVAPLVTALATPGARAQQPAAPAAELAVGADAPHFTLPGATRYGVLKTPLPFSDFKGKNAVPPFFYKARTKGGTIQKPAYPDPYAQRFYHVRNAGPVGVSP